MDRGPQFTVQIRPYEFFYEIMPPKFSQDFDVTYTIYGHHSFDA